jgi:hypothetical protein
LPRLDIKADPALIFDRGAQLVDRSRKPDCCASTQLSFGVHFFGASERQRKDVVIEISGKPSGTANDMNRSVR